MTAVRGASQSGGRTGEDHPQGGEGPRAGGRPQHPQPADPRRRDRVHPPHDAHRRRRGRRHRLARNGRDGRGRRDRRGARGTRHVDGVVRGQPRQEPPVRRTPASPRSRAPALPGPHGRRGHPERRRDLPGRQTPLLAEPTPLTGLRKPHCLPCGGLLHRRSDDLTRKKLIDCHTGLTTALPVRDAGLSSFIRTAVPDTGGTPPGHPERTPDDEPPRPARPRSPSRTGPPPRDRAARAP